jgi:pyruvate,water dikinase
MNRPVEPLGAPCDDRTELSVPLECATDLQVCGAKAVNLARMLRAGLPVPPGVVLTARALDAFIDASESGAQLARIESRLASDDAADALAAEGEVEALFATPPLPAIARDVLRRARRQLCSPLAVRSSAAGEDGEYASYAGLLCSSLDVEGDDALERALKRTWASRWSVRAARYRRGAAGGAPRMAVIVQSQIEARWAGVLFTRSPLPGRGDEMLCEYCSGTAERLVAGAITPARVCLARSSLAIREDSESPTDDAIAPAALASLASYALAAERLFGAAQDIEWAIDPADRVWLVQSRPITAHVRDAQGRIVWSNANVNENFPAPISPLLYSIAAPGYTHYFRNLGRAFGLSRRRLERMAPDLSLVIGVHAGRMYYNLSAIHSILRQVPCGNRLVEWFDDFTGAAVPAALGETSEGRDDSDGSPQGATRIPGSVQGEHGTPRFPEPAVAPSGRRGPRGPRAPWARSLRKALRSACELARIGFRTTWQYLFISRRVAAFERRIDAFAEHTRPEQLAGQSLIELRDALRAFLDIRLHRWTDAALADAAAMVCYGVLKAVVARTFGDAADAHLHNALLKGITGLKSAEPVAALWELARAVNADAELHALFAACDSVRLAERLPGDPRFAAFNARFEDYLERWGFRCSGELMLTVPSFQERPAELLEIIRTYANLPLTDPGAQLDAQRRSREDITARALAHARKQRVLA